MTPDQQEIARQIVTYADRIFVRECIDGKWGSYSLAEMPPKLALAHAMRFLREDRMPVVVPK